ncbi:MAG: hypothetical protein M0P39_06440 [Rhodocyclaceae bacterium]|jgi:midasin (ATPase involved in ribosome maturation)|nr:hypothetical protein [Rhodocyclaceae bacterium]
MKHCCSAKTDLDELIGVEEADGFHYGPLCTAMKQGEELILEHAALLPQLMIAKLHCLEHGLLIAETGERIVPDDRFHLLLS